MVRAVGGAALVVALAFGLAGCGGDDSEPGTVTVTTPTEAPDKQDASPTAEADQRRAEAALLTLDDFPAGWTATDDEGRLSGCSEVREAREAVTGRASSPDFEEDGHVGVQHVVYIYASENEAATHFDALTSTAARACLGEDLADAIAENIEGKADVQDETASELRVEPIGSESAAIRVTIPYTSDYIDGEVVFDAVFVRVGRGLSLSAMYTDIGSPDDEQRDQLVGVAARRLNQELD